jgi:hypothetical protein
MREPGVTTRSPATVSAPLMAPPAARHRRPSRSVLPASAHAETAKDLRKEVTRVATAPRRSGQGW